MLWYWNKFLAGAIAVLLLAGIGIEGAFAQTEDPIYTGAAASAASGPQGSPGTSSSLLGNLACTLIDFEGVGDMLAIDSAFAGVTFLSAQAAVDSDAGGTTGNIANEPSPSTIMTPFFLNGFATVTLDNPVNEIRVFHSSLGFTAIRVFDTLGVSLAFIQIPMTPVGPGDPNGGTFGTWEQVIHSEPFAVIKKVQFFGDLPSDRTGYDNFEFCITVAAIGGEISPTTTSALLLAGAQNSMAWMIPVIVSAIGIGIVIARKF